MHLELDKLFPENGQKPWWSDHRWGVHGVLSKGWSLQLIIFLKMQNIIIKDKISPGSIPETRFNLKSGHCDYRNITQSWLNRIHCLFTAPVSTIVTTRGGFTKRS